MTISRASYGQHVHTLRSAYRLHGADEEDVAASFAPYAVLAEAEPEAVLATCAAAARARLERVSPALAAQVLAQPSLRAMDFAGVSFQIPLLNAQGVEWYGSSAEDNFDFVAERSLGLLEGARTIYDFGGHQGVWAAYYAKMGGPACRVLSFEPSLVNVEVSAAQFLINDIANAVTVAAAVGTTDHHEAGGSEAGSGMLVDFVEGDFPVFDVRSLTWAHADFVKMDIEGFEYDLLTRHPWLFQLGRNMHLELHIPHLEKRGLDHRDVLALLPFDEFDIIDTSTAGDEPVTRDTPLSGFCSLMMKRR